MPVILIGKMKTITATELVRNLGRVLDRVVADGEEFVIERNHEQIARLVAGPRRQSAIEAMADLYRTLPEDVAATWERDDARITGWKGSKVAKGLRDPWAS
jgi:antitoxin (DNA-binding transcriptional repressor) of toxin-antitoxin stability system